MLVNIFGTIFFMVGMHSVPHGCVMTSHEKNIEYVTGASCEDVLKIIDLQRLSPTPVIIKCKGLTVECPVYVDLGQSESPAGGK